MSDQVAAQRFVGAAPVTFVACRSGGREAGAFVYANQPVPAIADPTEVARLAEEGFLAPARGHRDDALTTTPRGRS